MEPLTFCNFSLLKHRPLTLGKLPRLSATKKKLNPFRQCDTKEVKHSRIICDILNYDREFLRLFFEIVLNDAAFQYDRNETWHISTEYSKEMDSRRIDIYIHNHDYSKIIVVENKSNKADDGENQLYRYWCDGIRDVPKKVSGKTYAKILYLSPSKFKKWDKQSVSRPSDWGNHDKYPAEIDDQERLLKLVLFQPDITNWLEECLKLQRVKETPELSVYLQFYLDFWRNDFMTEEYANQVNAIFEPGIEQWTSFLELRKIQDWEITAKWAETLQTTLNRRFCPQGGKWAFASPNSWDYRWYLSEFGPDSVGLCLFCETLFVRGNPDIIDAANASVLLSGQDYTAIRNAFERIDAVYIPTSWSEEEKGRFIIERGNFFVGDKDDGHLSADKFAYYAHFSTSTLEKQIAAKIERFQTPEVTALFKTLNEECKK